MYKNDVDQAVISIVCLHAHFLGHGALTQARPNLDPGGSSAPLDIALILRIRWSIFALSRVKIVHDVFALRFTYRLRRLYY